MSTTQTGGEMRDPQDKDWIESLLSEPAILQFSGTERELELFMADLTPEEKAELALWQIQCKYRFEEEGESEQKRNSSRAASPHDLPRL